MNRYLVLNNKQFLNTYIEEIAHLHKKNIHTGFLSSLGRDFLKLLYSSIQKSDVGILIAEIQDNKVVGFVSGTTNINRIYMVFLKKNFIRVIITLLPHLISFPKLKKIGEILLYPISEKRSGENIPSAELLSMVVDEKWRRKGVGENLYRALVEEFKKRGISKFKIVVGENLDSAQKFYEKMGAKKVKKMEIHKGKKSWIYIHEIG